MNEQDENPCGSCTLCCKLKAVDELAKPACTWCQHADPKRGCTAYEARPQSCREWSCVWLLSQARKHGEAALPPELRPDRSRVVLDVRGDGRGLVFNVDPDRPDAHTKGAAGRLLQRALGRGEEVIVIRGDRRTLLRGQ